MKLRKLMFAAVILVLALAVHANRAMALSTYFNSWKTIYPSSQSATNASCNLCHSAGGGTDLNGYGKDFATAAGSATSIAAALHAIESLNSDGDPAGASNLTEINAGAQPGWTPGAHNTLYDLFSLAPVSTNQNPPTITGNLDPPTTTNHAPVLGAIGNKTVNEGQLLQFTITATDSDGNALAFTGSSLPTGASLTDNHNGTATFAWTPSFSQAGNYPNVTVTVTDNGSPPLAASGQFTITVGNINRPPVLAAIGNITMNEGQVLQFTLSATDPDGDGLSFTAANLPTGAGVTDNHNGTAVFNWTPGFTQAGNYANVTVTVTDNGTPAQSASQSFTITVGNVNRPPVLGAIGNRATGEGVLLQFTITATDPDGDGLSFAAANLPTGAGLTDNHNGSATFAWTPAAGQTGNYPNVTVTVTDNGSPAQSASQSFTITVGNVNRPPVLGAIGNKTVNEGQLLSFPVSASDPDGNAIGFTAGNLPTGAALTDNHDGTAAFAWTPTFAQADNYTNVTITATDNGSPAQSASQIFTITVGNVNRPPVLGAIGNKTVNEGQLLSIPVSASDPDGDALVFVGSNIPAGATLTDNHDGTAAWSWTPATGQAGTYANVTVTVTDNGSPALSDAEAFTITVQGPVAPPPPPPSVTTLTIKSVKGSGKNYTLYVQGYVRPGGTTVTIVDANTKKTLGSVRAGKSGAWKAALRMQHGSMPCAVQAIAGSLWSSVKTVSGGSCGQNDDHED
ncbi:MAG TPA: Ig-like domain-containing protein [Verrucomicrobiae bacterium]|nr:Ig-like domain-containing protein [Verrucomicrobiae bacterium]